MSDTVIKVDDGAKSKEEDSSNNDKKMHVEESKETWSNLIFKKLLRPTRYFDPPDEAGSMTDSSCDSCEEQEDSPTRKRCFICASFEHVGEHCSVGHDSCPNDGSTCLKCGGMGHDMSLCKYEYTEDDLKDVRCYVCKSFGHLCCVGASDSISWAVSCYKCGRLGHVGLGCGRHYEEPPTCWGKRDCSSRLAAKKKRRLEKALATSAAIRDRLEKKKLMKLQEQEQLSTLDESNGKAEKNDGNFEEGSTSHQSNGKKIDENLEQDCTHHESNGKTKKDNVESEQSFTKEEEEEEPPIPEKSKDRSGWITEDSVIGKHQEAEFSHYTIRS